MLVQLQTALLFWQREFFFLQYRLSSSLEPLDQRVVFVIQNRRARSLPGGWRRRGIKIASGTTPKARSGWVRIQDFMWRTHPGTGRLRDISLLLTGRNINDSGLHPHRQAGGVQPTVIYPVMGHHGPGGSKTFPCVAVGEDEILGAGGDGHPDAVPFRKQLDSLVVRIFRQTISPSCKNSDRAKPLR